MTKRQTFSWRPRHTVLLAMVLANTLLFLCLVGAWAYTEQQARVLGDDARQACSVALEAERADPDELWFEYELTDPRFDGRNVLATDVELDGRLRTVRCTVTLTGTDPGDPVIVDDIEVLG